MDKAKEKTAENKCKEGAGGEKDKNLLGALCYIPFMWIGIIVSLFILLTEKKEDRFLKFHATQALMFYIVSVFFFFGVALFGWILAFIAAIFTYGIGGICVGLFLLLLGLIWLAFMFFAAWKAFQGEEYEIPFIGKVARKHT
ncbi:MAG: DUF4870 domain-containing protein [Candidatus Bilamarchaeaceae archaeon]